MNIILKLRFKLTGCKINKIEKGPITTIIFYTKRNGECVTMEYDTPIKKMTYKKYIYYGYDL